MQDMAEFICKSGTNGTALVFKKLLNVNMAVPFLNSVTKKLLASTSKFILISTPPFTKSLLMQ